MRPTIIAVVSLCCLVCFSLTASASVATFTDSSQTVTFTGLGGNVQGEGLSNVSWGSCEFDGTNSKCTVSAPYTGVGDGGVITMVVAYQGNGPVPLTATSISPGNDLIFLSLAQGSFTLTLTPTGGAPITFYDISTLQFFFSNPTCTGVASCAVGQVGLTQNATITGPVHGTFDPTPIISIGGVISASSYGAFHALAPSTWMEIYGSNLATVLSKTWGAADFDGNQAPSALGGTTVTVGGQPAYIDYVSPGQVNAQVPSNIQPGAELPVVVTTAGGSSAQFMITVNTTEPGMLAPGSFKVKGGQYVAALFPDAKTFVLPPGSVPGVTSKRAKPGDTIVLYGVGFGTVTPDNPAGILVHAANSLPAFEASFGGKPAKVAFAGLTAGYLGLYQFNIVVPDVAASDSVPFTFSVGGNAGTQTLVIAIQN